MEMEAQPLGGRSPRAPWASRLNGAQRRLASRIPEYISFGVLMPGVTLGSAFRLLWPCVYSDLHVITSNRIRPAASPLEVTGSSSLVPSEIAWLVLFLVLFDALSGGVGSRARRF